MLESPFDQARQTVCQTSALAKRCLNPVKAGLYTEVYMYCVIRYSMIHLMYILGGFILPSFPFCPVVLYFCYPPSSRLLLKHP